jgi:tetratricopeptide (TPR) repeat protein
MTRCLAHGRWLAAALFFVSIAALCAPLATISGSVRDGEGKPLPHVQLTLKIAGSSSSLSQSVSGNHGDFKFTGLSPGQYVISAHLAGYVFAGDSTITLAVDSANSHVELTLTKTGNAPKSPAESDHAPPQFEAAGVRGLIDSGGYSAGAQAATNSGLIKGMADIRRSEEAGLTAESKWPCALESSLVMAAKTDPADPTANRKLGEFYLAHNQPAKAIPHLEAARAEATGDDALSRDLALAWIENQEFDLARQLLIKLALHHSDSDIHTLLAQADEGSGLFKQASAEYSLAAATNPNENDLFGIGYELILAGLPSQAAVSFQAALRQYPASIKLLIGAGAAEFLTGNTSVGVDYFLRATDLDPADARPYPFLENASGTHPAQIDRISSSFRRYLETEPNNPDAAFGYALVFSNQRGPEATPADSARIETLLKRAIQLKPDFAKAHFQLGAVYSERQDYSSAIEEYETALRLDPNLNAAHYRLGIAYKRIGQKERASQEMKLFEDARAPQSTHDGSSSISIEEFVSVLRPRQQHSNQPASCPDTSR